MAKDLDVHPAIAMLDHQLASLEIEPLLSMSASFSRLLTSPKKPSISSPS
jgi:hypothetical protein